MIDSSAANDLHPSVRASCTEGVIFEDNRARRPLATHPVAEVDISAKLLSTVLGFQIDLFYFLHRPENTFVCLFACLKRNEINQWIRKINGRATSKYCMIKNNVQQFHRNRSLKQDVFICPKLASVHETDMIVCFDLFVCVIIPYVINMEHVVHN